MPILTQGIVSDESFSRLQSRLSPIKRAHPPGMTFEKSCAGAPEPAPLDTQPILERLRIDFEVRKKIAAIKGDRTVEIVRYVGGLAQLDEFKGINPKKLRAQADRIALEHKAAGTRRQILAQRGEALAQCLPGILLGMLAPQQTRELLSRGTAPGLHCHIGKQRAPLSRRNPDRM